MQSLFIEKEIAYTGEQLCSHWIYQNFNLLGDAIIGFIGPCSVSLNHMVDLEDVQNKKPIYSPQMLHFIIELYGVPLRESVCLQRLFITTLLETIIMTEPSVPRKLERRGDDLYGDKERKLSVSICTASPTSTLIHTGLNIQTDQTPVPTIGLPELGIEDIPGFAKKAMSRLSKEWEAIHKACYKVRAVT